MCCDTLFCSKFSALQEGTVIFTQSCFLSHLFRKNCDMSTEQFRTIFYFNFKLGQSAVETARQINLVWGPNSVGESTVCRWFQKFRAGDFSLEDEPRSGRPTVIQDEDWRNLVEADPSQTVG